MKVLRLYAAHDLRLDDDPVPQPAAGEVLVRVTAVSLCGSDLHWFSEGGIGPARVEKSAVTLGHEMAGIISSGERQGQRVAIDPAIACGVCEFCQQGNPNFCERLRFAGDGTTDGGLREYIAWPERCLYPLPVSIGDAEAALLEALGVALHSADLSHFRTAMRVGVFGCGPIGLLMVQLARLSGAVQIIATDLLSHRLEAARAYGATHTFLSDGGGENEAVWDVTGGRGVDVAIEAAGENAAVETSIAACKPGGRVVLIGIPADDRTAFNASVARRKGLTIKICRRMKHTYPRAIALVEKGLVDVRSLITHRYPLEQANQAFAQAEKRTGIKVVLEMQ